MKEGSNNLVYYSPSKLKEFENLLFHLSAPKEMEDINVSVHCIIRVVPSHLFLMIFYLYLGCRKDLQDIL